MNLLYFDACMQFSVLGPGMELEHGTSFISILVFYNLQHDVDCLKFYIIQYATTPIAESKKQLQILNLGGQDEDVLHYTWLMVEHNKTVEHDNTK